MVCQHIHIRSLSLVSILYCNWKLKPCEWIYLYIVIKNTSYVIVVYNHCNKHVLYLYALYSLFYNYFHTYSNKKYIYFYKFMRLFIFCVNY